MSALDLLGARPKSLGKGGYAALSGTGPMGERCKGCRHFERQRHHYTVHFKCGIGRQSRGRATDIKANAAACRLFEHRP